MTLGQSVNSYVASEHVLILIEMGVVQSYMRKSELRERANKRRMVRDEQHSKLTALVSTLSSNVPSEVVDRVLCAPSVADLQAMLKSGVLTSEQLLTVYIGRAHNAGYTLNAVTEECYESALQLARQSDDRRARGESPRSMLEGIPFSVKDMFHMAGTDSTCGLAAKCFKPVPKDGAYVALLKDAGAIPFVKSNIPQCLMVRGFASALVIRRMQDRGHG